MDASIGRLHLVGRVVGPAHHGPRSDVVDLLSGDTARRRMHQALSSAFDSEEVVVIRSMTCRATVRAEAGTAPDSLARSIAASAVRLLRDHPSGDDCVVRFSDVVAYVAAYIHDRLEGHQHRWYFDAFEPYRRVDGATDWAALITAHGDRRWQILAAVRANGDLESLLSAVDDREVRSLAVELGDDTASRWVPLVATAAEIVESSPVGRRSYNAPQELAATLAMVEPPPDWLDPASLGGAIATAATGLLASSTPPDMRLDMATMLAAARRHDWFDDAAFESGLVLPRRDGEDPADADGAVPVQPPTLSPRSRQVLADLSETVADPRLFLDANHPASAANLIRLCAALVEHSPQWATTDLARSLTAHVLRVWEDSPASPAPPGAILQEVVAEQTSEPSAPAPAGPRSRASIPERQTPPLSLPATRAYGEGSDSESSSTRPTEEASALRPGRTPERPSPRSVAAKLNARFPRTDRPGVARESATACALLLLREVLALGLGPYLLAADQDGEPMLAALLRRWAGQPSRLDAIDPLLAFIRNLSEGSSPTADSRDRIGKVAARRMLGQHLTTPPLQLVTVPYSVDEFATVVIDSSDLVLPLGSLGGAEEAARSIDALGSGTVLDPGAASAETQAGIAGALASVCLDDPGSGDRRRALDLDLLALSCVQAWARWLPGFADARVPFLLSTVVRRPAGIVIDTTELTVYFPPKSHDIVLELAGYLEPLPASPLLSGRTVRFVVSGGDHGR